MTKDQIPNGYVAHQLSPTRLLLPSNLSKALNAEAEARSELEKAFEKEAAEPIDSITEDSVETAPSNTSQSSRSIFTRLIYTLEELESLANRAKRYKDNDEVKRLTLIVRKLRGLGITREFQLADPSAVASMAAEFPHFSDVINLVHQRLLLAQKMAAPPVLPPLLLHGGPGLGKTHFTRALAKILGGPCRTVQFDTGAENSALLGLDKQWSNSEPGILFELLCQGPVANPVVLLEELDKTHRFSDSCPLDALHALLEPSTSASVRDMCLELQFDASAVTYISTANELGKIPEPLQSRFEVFEVRQPTSEESIQIAEVVTAAVVREYGFNGFSPASRRVVIEVAHLTARGVRKAVTAAIANAVLNGRDYLKVSDLRIEGDAATATWFH